MKPMVSKKGSQQVVVLGGNGCVTISATDRKKHVSNSVTVFDELLPGLIARLSAIAASRPTKHALDGGDSAPSQTLSTPEVLSPSLSDSASRPAAQ